jgi:hypothetical protein
MYSKFVRSTWHWTTKKMSEGWTLIVCMNQISIFLWERGISVYEYRKAWQINTVLNHHFLCLMITVDSKSKYYNQISELRNHLKDLGYNIHMKGTNKNVIPKHFISIPVRDGISVHAYTSISYLSYIKCIYTCA